MQVKVGDVVMYHGSYCEWRVIEIGVTPGRTLSSGYVEPDWSWVALKRADGTYPDFIDRISINGIYRINGMKVT